MIMSICGASRRGQELPQRQSRFAHGMLLVQHASDMYVWHRVGRRLLRSLLHNEVGLVGHRRAWAAHQLPNAALLALYKKPHRVYDWDRILVQVGSLAAACLFSLHCRQRLLQPEPALLQCDIGMEKQWHGSSHIKAVVYAGLSWLGAIATS